MAFFLGASNLSLHRLASTCPTRPGLAGVFVDPARGLTAASDGRCLVEITAPAVKKFNAGDIKLANGESKPFVLAAKSAQALAKLLSKGKSADDPAQYAALAAAKDGQPPAFVVIEGKTARAVPVETVDAEFPDYRSASVFPYAEPLATLVANPTLLRDLIATATLGDAVTIHLLKDRMVLLSKKSDGTQCRAVLMGLTMTALAYEPMKAEATKPSTKPAPAPVEPTPEQETETDEVEDDGTDESEIPEVTTPSEAKSVSTPVDPAPVEDEIEEVEEAEVEPEPEPMPEPVPTRATFRRSSHRRRYYGRPSADGAPASGPTPAQRAFHTFLIRSRGGEVLVEDLSTADVSMRIDELKAQSEVGDLVATWPQWRKLFLLLAEQKANPDEVCEVLNGLTDIKHTSSVIAERLSADSPAKAAA